MRNTFWVFILLILAGCAKPLPEDKLDYAGTWIGSQISLIITTDGRVLYERVEGSFTTSIEGPIKEFNGDDFCVGFLFLTANFHVSNPPYEEDGIWQMTVDDARLTRVD
ncbi:hypothetical protein ACJJI4_10890 [Microbulbifer sp. TRSA002]|uniref:hypothetical protein n=1 Tax=Microbulbifer sp. TRSA002 TaxID=3243382 RepID=UPI00403A51C5